MQKTIVFTLKLNASSADRDLQKFIKDQKTLGSDVELTNRAYARTGPTLKASVATATQTISSLRKEFNELQNRRALGSNVDLDRFQQLREEIAKITAAQKASRQETKLTETSITSLAKNGEGAYRALSARLIVARKNVKDLAAAGKTGTTAFKQQIAQVNELDKQLKGIDESVGQYQRSVGNYQRALSGLGRLFGIASVGAATIQLIRKSAQAVAEFDKQLIAVSKTTDLVDGDLDKFAEDVLKLGINLRGISTQSLLESSEIAGQLGINASADILIFAETIERLRISSNLASEESVRAFAKFIEISSDTVENADRLGSVITRLGNNFATTEKDIIGNALEIQKGASIYKTSAENILAIGAATEALGNQQEVSRSALQKVLAVLDEAAVSGKNLEEILRLTGLTEQQFAKQFREDASNVFVKFIEGLNKAGNEGENLRGVLNGLQITEKRAVTVVGSLANNYNVLERAVSEANDEYERNEALIKESDRAADSISSKLGDVSDGWKNLVLSIDNGSGAISTALKGLLDGISSVFEGLSNFNDSAAGAFAAEALGNGSILGVTDAYSSLFDVLSTFSDEQFTSNQSTSFLRRIFVSREEAIEVKKEIEDIRGEAVKLEEGLSKNNTTSSEFVSVLGEIAKAREENKNVTFESTEEAKDYANTIQGLRDRVKDLTKTRDNAIRGTEEFRLASLSLQAAQNELTEATRKNKVEVDKLQEAYERLINGDSSIENLRTIVGELEKTLTSQELSDSELVQTLTDISKFNGEIEEQTKRIEDQREALRLLLAQREGAANPLNIKPLVDDLKRIREEAEQTRATLEGITGDDINFGSSPIVDQLPVSEVDDRGAVTLFNSEQAKKDKERIDGFIKEAGQIGVDEFKNRLKEEEEALKESEKRKQDIIKTASDLIKDVVSQRFDDDRAKVDSNLDAELEAIQSAADARIDAAKGNAKLIEQIEQETEAKRKEAEKKAAKERQSIRIKEAIAQAGLATLTAIATGGPFSLAALAPVIAAGVASVLAATFEKGGFTGGLGFKDHTGHEVAGVVHKDEYVAPSKVLKDPESREPISKLEKIRKKLGYTGNYAKSAYQGKRMSKIIDISRNKTVARFVDGGFTDSSIFRANGPIQFIVDTKNLEAAIVSSFDKAAKSIRPSENINYQLLASVITESFEESLRKVLIERELISQAEEDRKQRENLATA